MLLVPSLACLQARKWKRSNWTNTVQNLLEKKTTTTTLNEKCTLTKIAKCEWIILNLKSFSFVDMNYSKACLWVAVIYRKEKKKMKILAICVTQLQNILCRKTHLHGTTHEPIIICRQLGHVVDSKPIKKKKNTSNDNYVWYAIVENDETVCMVSLIIIPHLFNLSIFEVKWRKFNWLYTK